MLSESFESKIKLILRIIKLSLVCTDHRLSLVKNPYYLHVKIKIIHLNQDETNIIEKKLKPMSLFEYIVSFDKKF